MPSKHDDENNSRTLSHCAFLSIAFQCTSLFVFFYYIQNNFERIPKLYSPSFFASMFQPTACPAESRPTLSQCEDHQLRIMLGPRAVHCFILARLLCHRVVSWSAIALWSFADRNGLCAFATPQVIFRAKWICLQWLYDDLKIVYGHNLNKSNSCKTAISCLNGLFELRDLYTSHVNDRIDWACGDLT